jgi:hypothetical protein
MTSKEEIGNVDDLISLLRPVPLIVTRNFPASANKLPFDKVGVFARAWKSKSRVSGIVCNCGAGFVIIPGGLGCTTSSRTSLRADACGGRKIVPVCYCVIAHRDLGGNQ